MSNGSGDKKQLGKILLKQRLVTQAELDELLAEQRTHPGQRLATTAVKSGKVAEVDLLKALSEQHGLPGIDLTQVVIPSDNLKLVPVEIARQHLILPVLVKEDRVYLAMADPNDRRVVDEIEFVTGLRVFAHVALHEALKVVIDYAYAALEANEPYYIGSHVTDEYLASVGITPPPRRAAPPPVPPAAPTRREEESRVAAVEIPTAATRPRPERPKVLVVDDEDDIRKLLTRVLQTKGYQVIEAKRGLEALQLVRDDTPDVILLDAMLPEVHGFEICRRIKGSKRYGHIPIIMVSAIYRGWRVAEDLKSSFGVDAFLEKPFKMGDVLSHVDAVLDGRSGEVQPDDMLSKETSAFLEQGMDAYRGGDLELAVAKLRQGLGVDPASFQLHYHLGLVLGRGDDIFDAIQELETAVDLQPRHFAALKNLAILYQRAGFKYKAIEMWERALGNSPDDETRQGIKEHLMALL
ncbi:MAG: response regulator [Sandaracinaceae bacterium]|nr:response regulator [Sandaracinaceae bacterium]